MNYPNPKKFQLFNLDIEFAHHLDLTSGGSFAHLTPTESREVLDKILDRTSFVCIHEPVPTVKQTGFPKDKPDSLYRRDSPWISSYHIQNSFQSNITDITHIYNITWVYLLYNPKDCITNLRVQAPWAKRKQTESGNDN